jgi:hypothetical protein
MGIELIITVCMGKKKIDLNEFFFPSPQEWSKQALKVHGTLPGKKNELESVL